MEKTQQSKKQTDEKMEQQKPDGNFQSAKGGGDTLNESKLRQHNIPNTENKEPRKSKTVPGNHPSK